MAIVDCWTLHNGVSIPCIGFGTYKMTDEAGEKAVAQAIRTGYRHIDTAAFYHNEVEVGAGIRSSGVAREEIFLTTKVWNTERGYERAIASAEQSMKLLQVDYLDLLLIHWPANEKQFGPQAAEINAKTWQALEELYRAGKVRAIGVSNFLPHHLERLKQTAQIMPMVDQIEFHPGWAQPEVVQYCQSQSIVVEAWSPLARRAVLEHEILLDLAEKYGKTTAQICIRWALQHRVLPLPKTATSCRMAENMDVFDFALSEQDMQALDALHGIGGQERPDEIDF